MPYTNGGYNLSKIHQLVNLKNQFANALMIFKSIFSVELLTKFN